MSDNWSIIKEEVSTYRNYVEKLPAKAKEAAKYSYVLTKEEIDRLLALKENSAPLDGIRIYLGGTEIIGYLVPTIHIVAVEKQGALYNDYNVPKAIPVASVQSAQLAATAPAPGGSTGSTFPCPNYCSPSNVLNP